MRHWKRGQRWYPFRVTAGSSNYVSTTVDYTDSATVYLDLQVSVGYATIAIDQVTIGGNKQIGSGLGTTFSFTTTQPVAAGGTIVVGGGWYAVNTTVIGVSGGGLSWTIDKQASQVVNSYDWLASAYAPAGLAAGTTITVTYGLSIGYPTIGGLSFTGIAPAAPVVGTALGPTEVATAGWSTGSYAISGPAAIVALNYSEGVVTGNTPTSPSIESGEQVTAADQAHVIEYRIEPTAGSFSVAGAWNAASTNTTIGVAYKAAVASYDILQAVDSATV